MFRQILLLLLLATLPPGAMAVQRPPEGSEFQLFIENDMLARTDRYYTNDPACLSFPGIERFTAIETVFVEG